MNISVIGTGYVGLVTSVCLSDTGNQVVGIDVDTAKVEALQAGHCPIYEPGLSELLQGNLQAGRLSFTTDLAQGLRSAEVVFLAVGTPACDDGSADLANLERVALDTARHVRSGVVVAIKSTVPVGTGERIEAMMNGAGRAKVVVVSNPEFLKEGTAVDDFLRPDRVIIGADDAAAAERVRELFLPYVRNQRPILLMSRRAAEMTKYAANAYLATRISFINEIANLCERVDVDVKEVRLGIGTDARIGCHFLYPGCGYGGSCFPKDVQALAAWSRQAGYDPQLIAAVHAVNERQKRVLFEKLKRCFGGQLAGRTVAVWGVAFKPKTDDIREAPAVVLIEQLLEAGATVRAHDPKALDSLRRRFGERVAYLDGVYQAAEGADALVVATEWNEFANPDFKQLKAVLRRPLIVDGRNLYEPELMKRHGFEYHPVGRPAVEILR
jgi:UDPglucose 6-dehydrogenase